jgi:hypothetical protein
MASTVLLQFPAVEVMPEFTYLLVNAMPACVASRTHSPGQSLVAWECAGATHADGKRMRDHNRNAGAACGW